MTSVKINRKEVIEKIREKLGFFIEKKLSNQEILDKLTKEEFLKKLNNQNILDKFTEFTDALFDVFIQKKDEIPELTDEKRIRILSRASNYKDYYEDKSDDELLYSIKED